MKFEEAFSQAREGRIIYLPILEGKKEYFFIMGIDKKTINTKCWSLGSNITFHSKLKKQYLLREDWKILETLSESLDFLKEE
jgi:hypothetical protein